MFNNIEKSWHLKLQNEFLKPYFKSLCEVIKFERKFKIIYPLESDTFSCFNFVNFYDVKVVIVGQDPYCNANQAHGLAFSVLPKVKIPSSLVNIYKELYNDLGIIPSKNGNLENWAKQGVLLLNTVLTVEDGKPGSHFNFGWELFSDAVIKMLSESNRHIIFVLWGKLALEKSELINFDKNIILHSAHPSPMSVNRGFFGSRPFSKINFNLKVFGKKEINWRLD